MPDSSSWTLFAVTFSVYHALYTCEIYLNIPLGANDYSFDAAGLVPY